MNSGQNKAQEIIDAYLSGEDAASPRAQAVTIPADEVARVRALPIADLRGTADTQIKLTKTSLEIASDIPWYMYLTFLTPPGWFLRAADWLRWRPFANKLKEAIARFDDAEAAPDENVKRGLYLKAWLSRTTAVEIAQESGRGMTDFVYVATGKSAATQIEEKAPGALTSLSSIAKVGLAVGVAYVLLKAVGD